MVNVEWVNVVLQMAGLLAFNPRSEDSTQLKDPTQVCRGWGWRRGGKVAGSDGQSLRRLKFIKGFPHPAGVGGASPQGGGAGTLSPLTVPAREFQFET